MKFGSIEPEELVGLIGDDRQVGVEWVGGQGLLLDGGVRGSWLEVVLHAAVGVGADPDDEDKADDDVEVEAPELLPMGSAASDAAPEIEGEWQMVACSADGITVPDSMVATGRRIARGRVTESFFGNKRLVKAGYSVNKQVSPHTGVVPWAETNG